MSRGIRIATAIWPSAVSPAAAMHATTPPTPKQIPGHSFVSELTAAGHADHIAWVEEENGVRNIWAAAGPGFAAH